MRLILLVALVGCVHGSPVVCDDGRLCPADTVCAIDLCVSPNQVAACDGRPDATACDLASSDGSCHGGVCLPAACGNGRMDATEACDDGNTTDGDGCSSDCASTEICGNGAIDLANGETCDDMNQLDHDGCSSACLVEPLDWRLAPPAPNARACMGAAFDPVRRRVVIVGGNEQLPTGQIHPLSDTWEWDGIWRATTAPQPPTRSDFALAYDAGRGGVVLFAGRSNVSRRDTWLWNGGAWTRLVDAPVSVFGHAMAYDTAHARMIAFGGYVDNTLSSATLELDATEWIAKKPMGSPPARAFAAMTYDPIRHVIVMFGGLATNVFRDIWEYDGTAWIERTPSTGGPPPLASASLAYDARSQRVVLFGGVDENGLGHGETWTWNGAMWTQLPGPHPSGRACSVLVEDGRERLLAFGGIPGFTGAPLDDTWILDGNDWRENTRPDARFEVAVANDRTRNALVLLAGAETWELSDFGWRRGTGSFGPPALDGPQLAFDAARGETVLFGGVLASVTYPETWLWNGATWQRPTLATKPPGRYLGALAYDASRDVTIAYGGQNEAVGTLDDTWAWNGAAWTELHPAHAPGARYDSAMAYDWIRHEIVLFGGSNQTNPLDDTWIWDGTDWHEAVTTGDRPSGIQYARMVWDPARSALVLVQPGSVLETWEWTGTAWHQLLTNHLPASRQFGGVFETLDGGGIGLIYGVTPLGATLDDVWELRNDASHASDSCAVESDGDGDHLVGCADPDCWPTCDPLCPPGACGDTMGP